MRALANIFWLGTKELRSFIHDYVLVGLVIWAFSLAVYAQAQSRSQELHNAAIAVIDEDNSQLSHRVIEGFLLPPYFNPPQSDSLARCQSLDGQRALHIHSGYPAAFRAGCSSWAATGHTSQCRCDSDGPGRARRQLYPANSHDSDQRFSRQVRKSATITSQPRDSHRVQSQ